jgi:hypothetical protein
VKEVRFESPTEDRRRLHGSDVFRKIVPHLRAGHWESPATNCRQLEGLIEWQHQAAGTSRAEGLLIREMGNPYF